MSTIEEVKQQLKKAKQELREAKKEIEEGQRKVKEETGRKENTRETKRKKATIFKRN